MISIIGYIFATMLGVFLLSIILFVLVALIEFACDTYDVESPIKTLFQKLFKPVEKGTNRW